MGLDRTQGCNAGQCALEAYTAGPCEAKSTFQCCYYLLRPVHLKHSTTLEICPNGPVEGPVVRLDARSYCIEIPTIEAPLHLTPSSEGVSSDA